MLSGQTRRPKAGKTEGGDVMAEMLKQALALIVNRVICRKEGADVIFAPNLFDEPWGRAEGLWSEANILNGANVLNGAKIPHGENEARSTYQTTCIVCRVENSVSVFSTRRLPIVQRSAV